MSVQLTIQLTNEDLLNLERLKARWPRWTENMIICKALAVYANQQQRDRPLQVGDRQSAKQAIEELFGPID